MWEMEMFTIREDKKKIQRVKKKQKFVDNLDVFSSKNEKKNEIFKNFDFCKKKR